jgi:hypothetical protein
MPAAQTFSVMSMLSIAVSVKLSKALTILFSVITWFASLKKYMTHLILYENRPLFK